MENKPRLLRITTVPVSLKLLLKGQFSFFKNQGFNILAASSDGPEVPFLKDSGIQHAIIPMTRQITPLKDLYCLFRLIVLIKRFNPHIVHTHTPKAGLLGMMAAWICRVPVRMHTVAGLPLMEATGIKKLILKITERITYACAHCIYPNSKGLMEYIKSQIVNRRSQISIIGKGSSNGIDAEYFSRNDELIKQAKAIRVQHNIPDDCIVFSFVGRIVKDKGIVELVEAFQKMGNAKLLLIGSFEEELDPLPAQTKNFIQNNTQIIMSGFQEDIRPWMMASDIFVFPSYREGFPNVVMQAACLGIPCIVSDINGCNEIIENGITGLVVPVKNTEKLFEAMYSLASDKPNALAMASRSSEFVRKNFKQEIIWQELLHEYQYYLTSKFAN